MEYVLADITKEELKILESSDIDWYPDDIMSDNKDVVFESEKDREQAAILIGRMEKMKISEYDFSLFQKCINTYQAYTGEFIKKWCEYHIELGDSNNVNGHYYEASTIYKNHWENSKYKPNPKVYYYPDFGTARVGYIIKRDLKKSPKKNNDVKAAKQWLDSCCNGTI